MNRKGAEGERFLRDLVYFPVVFNVVGLPVIFVLYAISPGYSVDSGTLNTVVLASLFLPWWLLAFVVVRRLRREGVAVRERILPKRKFSPFSAVLVFVVLNVLFQGYMIASLIYGRIPLMTGLHPLQIVFFVALVPVTAGVTEELIWRGYFIDKLLASGRSETKAVVYSALSWAFIHGIFLPDKIVVTFVFGIIAGFYYVRERNLLVLILTHIVVDVISYALTIFGS